MHVVGLFLALSLFMLGSEHAWAGSRDAIVTSSHGSNGYHVSQAQSFQLVAHGNWKKKKRWYRHAPRGYHWKKRHRKNWHWHAPRGYHWKKAKRKRHRHVPYGYHWHRRDSIEVVPLFLGLLLLHDLARH